MSIKLNLIKNAGAGAWGKTSLVIFQLIQVPLFISVLGVEDYGRWVVLYSLPSWLLFANFGFGSVASTEMTIAVAAGDISKARSLFATTAALLLVIVIGLSLLTIVGVAFIPWEKFLKDDLGRHAEFSRTVTWLVVSVLISFYGELYGGRFRAAKKAHVAIIMSGIKVWLDLACLFVTLQFTRRLDFIAMSIFASTTTYLLIMRWTSYRALSSLSFSVELIEQSRFKELLRKATAFQAFPVGNAMLFQGTILVVQSLLGPSAVALFGTLRTLVRTVTQGMELVNQTIWPELSYLFGSGDTITLARLHRTSIIMSLGIATVGMVTLAVAGPQIYKFWIGNSIQLDRHLLNLFLLTIPFNSLWITSSVIHMASNRHEGLARLFLLASVLALACCWILSHFKGIEGAVLSTITVDVILIPYVLQKSLKLTGDTWDGLLKGSIAELRLIPVSIKKVFRTHR